MHLNVVTFTHFYHYRPICVSLENNTGIGILHYLHQTEMLN